jgi:hypothetical protein
VVGSDWLTFGARCGSGWGPSDGAGRALAIASARTDAREKAQGRLTSLYSTVAGRNSKSDFESDREIFSDRSRRFPINRGGGEGGGRVRNFFFGIFFFLRFWGRGGGRGRVTPKPEAQVARFLVGMFRNQFLEAGDDAKVSPKVAKE